MKNTQFKLKVIQDRKFNICNFNSQFRQILRKHFQISKVQKDLIKKSAKEFVAKSYQT